MDTESKNRGAGLWIAGVLLAAPILLVAACSDGTAPLNPTGPGPFVNPGSGPSSGAGGVRPFHTADETDGTSVQISPPDGTTITDAQTLITALIDPDVQNCNFDDPVVDADSSPNSTNFAPVGGGNGIQGCEEVPGSPPDGIWTWQATWSGYEDGEYEVCVDFTQQHGANAHTGEACVTYTVELSEDPGDDEGEPAAPAVAARLLHAAGINARYGEGRNGGNHISDVAHNMGPETDFDGISKEDVVPYCQAVAEFLQTKNPPANVDENDCLE